MTLANPKNGYSAVNFIDTEVQVGVVTDKSHPQHMIQALKDHASYLFKILACEEVDSIP